MIATPGATAPAPRAQTMRRVRPTSPERDAILAGLRAADAALARARRFAVLELFVGTGQPPNAEPRLEALRAYAELRRALLPQGYWVPTTSLSAMGFTVWQIAQFDALITAAPPS